jgi:hypothetical protein
MDAKAQEFRDHPIGRFLLAPVQLRTYANLLYLALAFPLGLAYFVFLTVGLSLGIGLLIILWGLPVLALVVAASRGIALLERQLAIHLLGAEVPPMAPMAAIAPMALEAAEASPSSLFWQRLKAMFTNLTTWKGLGYLAVKFPLGLATFVFCVTLSALTLSFLLAPFYYEWSPPLVFYWEIDTLSEALLCSLFGLGLGLVSLNLFNGLAFLWQQLASAMLGSRRFAVAREAAPVYVKTAS